MNNDNNNNNNNNNDNSNNNNNNNNTIITPVSEMKDTEVAIVSSLNDQTMIIDCVHISRHESIFNNVQQKQNNNNIVVDTPIDQPVGTHGIAFNNENITFYESYDQWEGETDEDYSARMTFMPKSRVLQQI